VKGAFIYLVKGESESRFESLSLSIRKLGDYFNNERQYPIVIFGDNENKTRQRLKDARSPIHFAKTDEEDWRANQPNGSYPAVFTFWGTSYVSLMYRQMSRYSAGFLLTHPALELFDYAIKLDTERFLMVSGPEIHSFKCI